MCFYAKDCGSWNISNWCSCIHLSADYRKTQQSINPPRDNILILLQRLAWSEWRGRFIHEFTWVNEECERTQWLWHFQGRPSASTVCTQAASMITWRHQMGSGGHGGWRRKREELENNIWSRVRRGIPISPADCETLDVIMFQKDVAMVTARFI